MYPMIKRSGDWLLAATVLVLGCPLWLLLCLLIRLKLGRPIFFTQTRIGYQNQPFQLLKFRTMTNECDANGQLLADSQRLTKFGRLLRKTSLDELPQLLNILRGEMSLIGPRPLIVDYLPLYSAQQLKRHNVRPGLTGLAQVKGRNAISWEQKFAYDIEYTKKISWWQDCQIFGLTLKKVFQQSDISAADHATMKPFEGSQNANETDQRSRISR